MTTLWIFGDNFSAFWPDEIQKNPSDLKKIYTYYKNENTWQYQVADKLNANIENYALGFSSIEYLFKKFNSVRDKIQDGDTIIITVISPDIATRNFVRDEPFILDANTDFTKIRFHPDDQYISREDAFILYLNNFLYNLKSLTIEKNLNTIVIPSQKLIDCVLNNFENKGRFNPIIVAQGCLSDITINEYTDDIKHQAYYFRDDSIIKTNWLIQSNHKILSNKILESLNTKRLDVTQGFVRGVITDDNRKDKNFLEIEY